jgi:hypothetical protein
MRQRFHYVPIQSRRVMYAFLLYVINELAVMMKIHSSFPFNSIFILALRACTHIYVARRSFNSNFTPPATNKRY